MLPVLCDRRAVKVSSKQTYFMYRGVTRDRDRKLFARHGIRYDVTILPPMMFGREFNKTLGHYHEEALPGLSYPEVYEVLAGKAHYMLQKRAVGGSKVEEVVLVKARAGEKVVVPPNYGHVTINPSKTKPLVMANLVERSFKSDYEPFVKKRGAAYYETEKGMVANKTYAKAPQLRIVNARNLAENKVFKKNIYREFIDKPERFYFLKDPRKFYALK